MNMTERASPIIVALDFETRGEALALVDALGADADYYKVGLQLLTEVGPQVVRDLVARGKKMFLDLKLHAIPHSMAGGVTASQEAGYLKDTLPAHMLIITPGIQLPETGATDQARVATPQVAASAGASYVVIGRAVAKAIEPRKAFADALSQFQAGANKVQGLTTTKPTQNEVAT